MTTLTANCTHPEPVSVADLLDEHIAWLCPACDAQLPAEFVPGTVLPRPLPPALLSLSRLAERLLGDWRFWAAAMAVPVLFMVLILATGW